MFCNYKAVLLFTRGSQSMERKNEDTSLLLKHLQEGDERAFRTLFEEFYASLCLFATHYLGDREEAADVELVADVLLDKIYAAYDRRILGSMVGSILIVVKGLGLIHIRKVLHEVCHDLAKAALKLRRARSGENSTPITEEEAKEMLLCHISMIMALDTILFKNEEREQMEKIKEMKMERWAERLRGETADGNGIQ